MTEGRAGVQGVKHSRDNDEARRVPVSGHECEFTCRGGAGLTYPSGTWHSAVLTAPDSDSPKKRPPSPP